MDPSVVSPAWVARHRSLLTGEEAARAGSFGRDDLRHDYVCTRILQRLALSDQADVPPGDWRFLPAARGKPAIVAPVGYETLRFNISHTKGLVAVALCRSGEVGVDVEALDHARDVETVAQRFFAPEETEALMALGEAARPLRFLTLWTLKEAWLKATGAGLGHALDAARFELGPDGAVTADFDPNLAALVGRWGFASMAPTPRHRLALAVQAPYGQRAGSVRPRIHWPPTNC